MSIVTNPLVGTTLGFVDLIAISVVYNVLNKKISDINENIGNNTDISKSKTQQDSQLELLSRIEQLEMERDILNRKIDEHESVIIKILQEFRSNKDTKEIKNNIIRQTRILFPPQAEESSDDDEEARKILT